MAKISAKEVIEIIIDIIVSSYGSLGYVSFRVHSIKPNSKKGIYITKYSFIPRDRDGERIFYEARVNIKDRNIFETKEIHEEDLPEE